MTCCPTDILPIFILEPPTVNSFDRSQSATLNWRHHPDQRQQQQHLNLAEPPRLAAGRTSRRLCPGIGSELWRPSRCHRCRGVFIAGDRLPCLQRSFNPGPCDGKHATFPAAFRKTRNSCPMSSALPRRLCQSPQPGNAARPMPCHAVEPLQCGGE